MILTICMLLSMGPIAASAVDFSDVPLSHWAYDYIDSMVKYRYFVGTSNTTFEPETPMSRAMFVTFFARYAQAEVDNYASTEFADVAPGMWYSGSVVWAAENGIVKGTSATTFSPNTPLTREDMVVMVLRFFDLIEMTLPQGSSPIEFADKEQISSYAKDAVEKAVSVKLINGMGNGCFEPKSVSTRAQAAAIISHMLNIISQIQPEQPVPEPIPVSYRIKYNNLKEAAVPTKQRFTSSDLPLTLEVLGDLADYEFGGWFTEITYTTAITEIALGTNTNVEVWAKWIDKNTDNTDLDSDDDGIPDDQEIEDGTDPLDPNNYAVILTFNGGENGTVAAETIKAVFGTDMPEAPAVTADDNWVFDNWNPELPETVPGVNTTFTAQYKQTFAINYILNNGINNASNPEAYNGGDEITLSDPTRAGYDFLFWIDVDSKAYTSADVAITTAEIGEKTFEAKWSIAGLQGYYENLDGTYYPIDSLESVVDYNTPEEMAFNLMPSGKYIDNDHPGNFYAKLNDGSYVKIEIENWRFVGTYNPIIVGGIPNPAIGDVKIPSEFGTEIVGIITGNVFVNGEFAPQSVDFSSNGLWALADMDVKYTITIKSHTDGTVYIRTEPGTYGLKNYTAEELIYHVENDPPYWHALNAFEGNLRGRGHIQSVSAGINTINIKTHHLSDSRPWGGYYYVVIVDTEGNKSDVARYAY